MRSEETEINCDLRIATMCISNGEKKKVISAFIHLYLEQDEE